MRGNEFYAVGNHFYGVGGGSQGVGIGSYVGGRDDQRPVVDPELRRDERVLETAETVGVEIAAPIPAMNRGGW